MFRKTKMHNGKYDFKISGTAVEFCDDRGQKNADFTDIIANN